MFSYLPCVVSYFGQLISSSAESGSLDSEISQSLTSAKEEPLLRTLVVAKVSLYARKGRWEE